jgi:hypothetical protein
MTTNEPAWSQIFVADRGPVVPVDHIDVASDHRRRGRYHVFQDDSYWYARVEFAGGGATTHGDTIGPKLSEAAIRAAAQGSVNLWALNP